MIPREMLYIADEVFFSGTAAEITPIRSIDRIKVGAGARGPITKRIQDAFFAITSGKVAGPPRLAFAGRRYQRRRRSLSITGSLTALLSARLRVI